MNITHQTDIICKCDESSYMRQWCATMPLPKMIENGLTFKRLRNEIDRINDVSIESTGQLVPRWVIYTVCVVSTLVLILMVALSDEAAWMYVGAIAGTLGILSAFLCGCRNRKYKAYGWLDTKEYIEMDLNEKYHSKGIRWSVVDEQRESWYNHRNHIYYVHHIVVTALEENHGHHHHHHRHESHDEQEDREEREGRPDEPLIS